MADLIDEVETTPQIIESAKTSKASTYQTWSSLLSGSCAAAASKTCTAPLSRMTILMQLQGTGNTMLAGQTLGLWNSIKSIVKVEGLRSLWKGNLVSVIHKFPYGGINYFAYEKSKVSLHNYWNSDTDPGVAVRFACGFIGGSSASAATYPLDMLRTRLAASKIKSPRLFTMLSDVIKTEGPLALYKGMSTTLMCQGLNIAMNFAIYETLQVNIISIEKKVLKDVFGKESDPNKQRGSWLSSLLCGAVSGCVASLSIFPLDLIRRRQQANMGNSTSAREVLNQILKSEGWRGLYRGIAPEMVKVVPAVAINFYVYELIRQEVLGVKVAPR